MSAPPTSRRRLSDYVHARVGHWQTGSRSSQVQVLLMLSAAVVLTVLAAMLTDQVPATIWLLWLLVGVLVLRFGPLMILSVEVLVASVVAQIALGGFDRPRVLAAELTIALAVAVACYLSSRQRSGLPVALSETLLAQLRDRLQAQGTVPKLPHGWHSQSAMLTAHGTGYAGDFLVANLRGLNHLDLVLVDVCGKGVAVGPQALQFAGALGGLIGTVPQRDLMHAANDFLLRQNSDDSFATAVHVEVNLQTGDYSIVSAGHPPALRWHATLGVWQVDNARGLALGILPTPEHTPSRGRLQPGEALMFYTDGVIERPDRDLDDGIDWLRETAGRVMRERGFANLAAGVIHQVRRGDDDRAILVLGRSPGTNSSEIVVTSPA